MLIQRCRSSCHRGGLQRLRSVVIECRPSNRLRSGGRVWEVSTTRLCEGLQIRAGGSMADCNHRCRRPTVVSHTRPSFGPPAAEDARGYVYRRFMPNKPPISSEKLFCTQVTRAKWPLICICGLGLAHTSHHSATPVRCVSKEFSCPRGIVPHDADWSAQMFQSALASKGVLPRQCQVRQKSRTPNSNIHLWGPNSQ